MGNFSDDVTDDEYNLIRVSSWRSVRSLDYVENLRMCDIIFTQ